MSASILISVILWGACALSFVVYLFWLIVRPPRLQVFESETDLVIAYDVRDAIKVWEDVTGEKWEDYEDDEFAQFHPVKDEVIALWYLEDEIPNPLPFMAIVAYREDRTAVVRADRDAWIKLYGRGLLGSSEY